MMATGRETRALTSPPIISASTFISPSTVTTPQVFPYGSKRLLTPHLLFLLRVSLTARLFQSRSNRSGARWDSPIYNPPDFIRLLIRATWARHLICRNTPPPRREPISLVILLSASMGSH